MMYGIGALSLLAAGAILFLCVMSALGDDPNGTGRPACSARELPRQAGATRVSSGRSQIPPLVQQAQAFALYLDPPLAPQPAEALHIAESLTRAPEVKPAAASAPFELHGISYHSLRPEESMALVSVVGEGRRWVRPGAQLGHFTIDQIRANSILCSNGSQGQEMTFVPQSISPRCAQVGGTYTAQPFSGPVGTRGKRRVPGAHLIAREQISDDGQTR